MNGDGFVLAPWHVGGVANGLIALAYFAIAAAILIPLAHTRQLGRNKLGVATAAIFFSCAVHHGGHTIHLLAPSFGWHLHSGLAMRDSFNWYMAGWDVLSVVVAVYYWTLRRTYGSLMRGAQLFDDLEQRHRTEVAAADERARLADQHAGQQEALLRAVLDSIREGVVVVDATGTQLIRNPAADRFLGAEEMAPAVATALDRAVAGESIVGTELVLTHPDRPGGVPVLLNAHPLGGGHRAGVLVLHDITELRAADRQLRASEEQLSVLLDGARDYAIVMLDPAGRISSWSTNAERMHGYTEADVRGAGYEMLFTATDRAAQVPQRLLATARTAGRAEAGGLRVCRDGGTFYAQTVLTPVSGEDGELRGYVKVTNDITDRRRAEQAVLALNAELGRRGEELELRVAERTAQLQHHASELRRQATELRATNAELEAFSYSVSHDLRAPLRSMNGFATIIDDRYGSLLPPEGRRYLAKVRAAAGQMGQLIDALLAFSKLQRQAMKQAPVDPTTLVHEVWEDLSAERDGRDVRLTVGPLPPCVGDGRLLKQVFSNLLGNAVKYTARRDLATVEVGGGYRDGEVEYWVRDNGTGFDMRYAGKLFKVFQRLHRADDFDGTGIGLALVARIVARHGGQVWAEGRPDEGATFFVTVPEVAVPEPADAATREEFAHVLT